MSPPFFSPMNAMNSPMPQPIAVLRLAGIASTIRCRTPPIDSPRKSTPSQNTRPSAACHGNPPLRHIVNAKNAFRPMPGASASG